MSHTHRIATITTLAWLLIAEPMRRLPKVRRPLPRQRGPAFGTRTYSHALPLVHVNEFGGRWLIIAA